MSCIITQTRHLKIYFIYITSGIYIILYNIIYIYKREREISSFMLIAHSDWKPIFLVETNMTAPHISMIPVKFTSSSYTRWFSRDNWISRNVGGPRHFFSHNPTEFLRTFSLIGPQIFFKEVTYPLITAIPGVCTVTEFQTLFGRLYLVGGWTNPFEKYNVKMGSSSPSFGVNIKKYLSCHHPVIFWMMSPMTPLQLAHHRAVGG